MRKFQITGLFSPRSPLEFIGFALMSSMIGLVSAGSWLAFLFITLFAIVWWWWDQQRDRQLAAKTVFPISKEPPQPAKGLILLLSPFASHHESLRHPNQFHTLLQSLLSRLALTEADFALFHLCDSNLLPQIRAIEYHLDKGFLRDVWLISTTQPQSSQPQSSQPQPSSQSQPPSQPQPSFPGSETTAILLEKYLQARFGQRLDIHRQGLTIAPHDYVKLWQLGEQIFRKSGYRDEVLVADVTGGTKMMSVAIAMACIPAGRRMQYMDAERDWQGKPLRTGEITPVGIDIDPTLYPQIDLSQN